MARQIFISYSRQDIEFARRLSTDLTAAGYQAWFDHSIKTGEDWETAIVTKIKESDQVIIILSQNSLKSQWVQHEGSMAYGLNKSIYPIMIEPVEADELPLWSRKYQSHNFVDIPYDEAVASFIQSLVPPNPIQDLLDQQVKFYEESEMLLGRSMLQLFNQNLAQLEINDKARELINKSELRLSSGIISLAIVSIVILIIGYGFLYQERFQISPLDVQFIFWPLVVFFGFLGFRRGWYSELLNLNSILLVIFIYLVGDEYVFPDLGIDPALVEFLGICIFITNSIAPFEFLEKRTSTSVIFRNMSSRTAEIFSVLLGLVDGYLLAGSFWYYLHKLNFDFPLFEKLGSLPAEELARLEQVMRWMPPSFLVEPWIFIAVSIAFMLVLLVYV